MSPYNLITIAFYIKEVYTTMTRMLRDIENDAILKWNESIAKNVSAAVGAELDGSFIAANYPAGFNYDVKEQYYNADSLSAFDSLVVQTNNIPGLSGTFSTLYKNVVGNLEYGFSSEDEKLLNQEQTKQAQLVGQIVDAYKASGLDDDPDPYASVMYIIQRIKEVTGTDYLHFDAKTYPQLATLCSLLSKYACAGTFTYKMQNAWSLADDRMNAIIANITSPNGDNGGIKTDSKTYSIGWDKIPEFAQILASLQGDSSISVSMSTDNFTSGSSDLHFESDVKFRMPFNFFFNMSVDHGHSYDLSKYTEAGSGLDVTVTFKGITVLAAVPTQLSNDNAKGWFALDIMKEAAEKSGKDATGYQLHGSEFKPEDLFGTNGQLRRLKTFVISQQPQIDLHFSKFDYSDMQEIFTQGTDVEFKFFGGLIKGTHNNDYTFENYSYNEAEQTLNVSIVPARIGDTGTAGKQTAFVLGGVAEYYGD